MSLDAYVNRLKQAESIYEEQGQIILQDIHKIISSKGFNLKNRGEDMLYFVHQEVNSSVSFVFKSDRDLFLEVELDDHPIGSIKFEKDENLRLKTVDLNKKIVAVNSLEEAIDQLVKAVS